MEPRVKSVSYRPPGVHHKRYLQNEWIEQPPKSPYATATYVPRYAPEVTEWPERVTFGTWNLNGRDFPVGQNDDYALVNEARAREIEHHNLRFWAFQELGSLEGFNGFQQTYLSHEAHFPQAIVIPNSDLHVGAASHLPILDASTHQQKYALAGGIAPTRFCHDLLLLTVELSEWMEVSVFILHGINTDEDARNKELQNAARIIKAQHRDTRRPYMALGDYNQSPGDPALERFMDESGLTDLLAMERVKTPSCRRHSPDRIGVSEELLPYYVRGSARVRGVKNQAVSDHNPVTIALDIPPFPPSYSTVQTPFQITSPTLRQPVYQGARSPFRSPAESTGRAAFPDLALH